MTDTPIDKRAEKAINEILRRHDHAQDAHPLDVKLIMALVEQEIAEVVKPYNELIMAVGNKFEGETRHETALRYIRTAESQDNPSSEALRTKEK